MRRLLLLWFLLIGSLSGWATHIEAGEITYRRISGYSYEITVVIYAKKASDIHTPIDVFRFGDGAEKVLDNPVIVDLPGGLTEKRSYKTTHTYPGPGKYVISADHSNRISDIKNINSSVNVSFYLETELIINPFNPTGGQLANNSPVLVNPPLDVACVGAPFEHNPGAIDPDGDSLTYKLIACRGLNGLVLEYKYPDEINSGSDNKISIDLHTGDLLWDSPQLAGIYNVAILIEEWRNGQKVGSVIRDMQITVNPCTNKPPIISQVLDTCVEANARLRVNIHAEDLTAPAEKIVFSATGFPFLSATNKAKIDSIKGTNPVDAQMIWDVTCNEVRREKYQVILKATDNGNDPLTDYSSFYIKVVAPAVENLASAAQPSGINVSWSPNVCSNASCYKVYRRQNRSGYVHGYCETGVPASIGYSLIAQIGSADTSYFDSLVLFSTEYCYIITACFEDGSESYASEETCVQMDLKLPQIIKVSVGETNLAGGIDTIWWCHPPQKDSLLTNEYKGPYQYKLYRSAGFNQATQLVYESTITTQLPQAETSFIDGTLNTKDSLYSYRVELYSDSTLVGSSANASSTYLKIKPGDRQNTLTWDFRTPWNNDTFIVERFNNQSQFFEEIGRVTTPSFLDQGLINGTAYCYVVKAIGKFQNPLYPQQTYNVSQEACGVPVDKTPPCNPSFSLDGHCEQGYANINWENAVQFCNADLKEYQLLFSPTADGELSLIKTFSADDSTFVFSDNSSIAGCFAFAALDTNGNQSVASDKKCIDNCPDYSLPNVFTPNNDGVNDLFTPFPYRGVKEINIQIFSRWGKELFSTTNPDINWDGRSGGKPVPDGVYFYVAQVKKTTLAGEIIDILKGSVTIFTENKQQTR